MSRSTRWEPRKPPPPVTRIFMQALRDQPSVGGRETALSRPTRSGLRRHGAEGGGSWGNHGFPHAGRGSSCRWERTGDGCRPIDAAGPAVAVPGVPRDRAGSAVFPAHLRLPARLPLQLLVADSEGDHLARARPVPGRDADELATGGPVAPLLADAQDQLGPVAHRDV